MAQVEANTTPWDYFGKIPHEMGWRPENTIDNATEGTYAYTNSDSVTEGNITNEVSGRTALTGKIPNAVAEAKFHQTISEGNVRRGVQIEATNQGIYFPSPRRMTFTIQVLDPYPRPGELPEAGTHVVILFDPNAYLQVARLVKDDEEVGDLKESLLEGEIEPEVEDTPQVWEALNRMGLDPQNYRLRRLNVTRTIEELVLGASREYNEADQLLNPPGDMLALFVFDEVDQLQRYADTHMPEGAEWTLN